MALSYNSGTSKPAHQMSGRIAHLDSIRSRVPEYASHGVPSALDGKRYGDRYLKYRPINSQDAPYPHKSNQVTTDTNTSEKALQAHIIAQKAYPDVIIQACKMPGNVLQRVRYRAEYQVKADNYTRTRRVAIVAGYLSDNDTNIISAARDYRGTHLYADKRKETRTHIRPSASRARRARFASRRYRTVVPHMAVQHSEPPIWDQIHAMCIAASTASARERKRYRDKLKSICHHSDIEWGQVNILFRSYRYDRTYSDTTCNVVSPNIGQPDI